MMKWLKTRSLISGRQLLALLAISILTSFITFFIVKHHGINNSKVTELLSSLPRVTAIASTGAHKYRSSSIISHESFVAVMLDTYIYPQVCLELLDDCPQVEIFLYLFKRIRGGGRTWNGHYIHYDRSPCLSTYRICWSSNVWNTL